MKEISSNAYAVDLLDDHQITHKFNVADLFDFHGLDDYGKQTIIF